MCYRLEFHKGYDGISKAKNRMTVPRLILNIVGLFVILAIGATAAVLATYHEEWFPQRFFGSDAVYWRLSQNKDLGDIRSRIFKLTNETESRCEDSDKLIKDSLVFQCGSAAEARCIPMASLCDSKRDCADFSDEKDDVCPKFCELASPKGLRFSCMVTVGDSTKAQCLNSRMKCDGKVQCTGESEDRNDESDCEGTYITDTVVCSPENNWVCADRMMCVRKSDTCNGINDCTDGSDERESVCDRT